MPNFKSKADFIETLIPDLRRESERIAALRKVIHPQNAERVAAAIRRGTKSARKSLDAEDSGEND